MKLLVSAYACEPGKGSEPAVGWNWVQALARRGYQVHVSPAPTIARRSKAIRHRSTGRSCFTTTICMAQCAPGKNGPVGFTSITCFGSSVHIGWRSLEGQVAQLRNRQRHFAGLGLQPPIVAARPRILAAFGALILPGAT